MVESVGFPYVAAADARVLILGTLPGAESLRLQHYYAKKQNSFWRIMHAVIGIEPDRPYKDRLARLRQSGIALWDVCAAAERVGSLDSKIQLATIQTNDFAGFFKKHRHIELICFNGGHAEKLFLTKVALSLPPIIANIRRVRLPSTSPAHAGMRFEAKLDLWQKALTGLVHSKR